MKTKLPLKDCKLWWPNWQMGIPFNSYGYRPYGAIAGDGYEFRVDVDVDCWLCPDGSLMPIGEAVLEDCDEGPIKYSSFTIVDENKVQVNCAREEGGYTIDFYPLDALAFVGDTFNSEDE